LPVFCPDPDFLRSVEAGLVELPLDRVKRFGADYGLGPEQADLICEEKALADYFEAAVSEAVRQGLAAKDAAGRIANLLLQDVKHILGREGIDPRNIGSFALGPRRLASLTVLSATERVSGKNARQALEAAARENRDPEDIIRDRGWERLSDPAKIAEALRAVSAAEAATVAELRAIASGEKDAPPKRRQTLTAFLVGKVLAATGGRADPKIAGEQIEALIGVGKLN
ncbi:MAG: Asp-tRNA(Asn)/Glu-tRNA(Gln) amidotransferase GatCAB subunit B, partial [Treponema sp.]|nr:Asp-tRNA(Asn)/Glu-tRNA(Gln) amidotransferase GatCAB subunit B [Treponema sp.]